MEVLAMTHFMAALEMTLFREALATTTFLVVKMMISYTEMQKMI